ncbi:hypothetical protein F5887DRAFT_926167 [Amanita rubescens]|nr:hypothetical protein F5887DRAFT_926167 [Amanita rubescens]
MDPITNELDTLPKDVLLKTWKIQIESGHGVIPDALLSTASSPSGLRPHLAPRTGSQQDPTTRQLAVGEILCPTPTSDACTGKQNCIATTYNIVYTVEDVPDPIDALVNTADTGNAEPLPKRRKLRAGEPVNREFELFGEEADGAEGLVSFVLLWLPSQPQAAGKWTSDRSEANGGKVWNGIRLSEFRRSKDSEIMTAFNQLPVDPFAWDTFIIHRTKEIPLQSSTITKWASSLELRREGSTNNYYEIPMSRDEIRSCGKQFFDWSKQPNNAISRRKQGQDGGGCSPHKRVVVFAGKDGVVPESNLEGKQLKVGEAFKEQIAHQILIVHQLLGITHHAHHARVNARRGFTIQRGRVHTLLLHLLLEMCTHPGITTTHCSCFDLQVADQACKRGGNDEAVKGEERLFTAKKTYPFLLYLWQAAGGCGVVEPDGGQPSISVIRLAAHRLACKNETTARWGRDGPGKPKLDRGATVPAGQRSGGAEKPLLGEGSGGVEKPRWERVWWCRKTTAGRGSGGAKKPLLGEGLMVPKNHCWERVWWCRKTTAGRESGGVEKPRLERVWWCRKTTTGRGSGGAIKPSLGEGLVVPKNHYWARVWWCRKTTAGRESGGVEKPRLERVWWCRKTTTGRGSGGSGGAEKPLLGEGLVVPKNHCWTRVWWCRKTTVGRGSGGVEKPRWERVWWCRKTTVGWGSGGAEKPLLGGGLVVLKNHPLARIQWCDKTTAGFSGTKKPLLGEDPVPGVQENYDQSRVRWCEKIAMGGAKMAQETWLGGYGNERQRWLAIVGGRLRQHRRNCTRPVDAVDGYVLALNHTGGHRRLDEKQ